MQEDEVSIELVAILSRNIVQEGTGVGDDDVFDLPLEINDPVKYSYQAFSNVQQ